MKSVATPSTFKYFAYGSNMLKCRLCAKDRCPSAKVIGMGYIEGRRLTFDKLSQDGSGKCDAELTNRPTDRVYGVIFEIALTEKDALARAEGLGKGAQLRLFRSGRVDQLAHTPQRSIPIEGDRCSLHDGRAYRAAPSR